MPGHHPELAHATEYRRSSIVDRPYLPPTSRYDYRWTTAPDVPSLPPPRALTDEFAQYWPAEYGLKRKLGSEADHRMRADMYRDEPYARDEKSTYYALPHIGPSDAGRRLSSVHALNERMDSGRPRSNSVRSSYPTENRAVREYPAWRPEMPLPPPIDAAAAHRHAPFRPVHFDGATEFTSQQPVRIAPQTQRKRLRISRACDECRRRKTRCDVVGAFPGEPNHPLTLSGAVPLLEPNDEPKGDMLILQPCINCRRSDVTCSYSKRPLKRGPSKGYIKDLERRLNSLESQIVPGDKEGDEYEETDELEEVPAAKPKVRTEDRISRLESVLNRAPIEQVETPTEEKAMSIPRSPDLPEDVKPVAVQAANKKPESDVSEVKTKVMQSFLHGTFPVLPFREATSDIAQLEERVLARGMRLLLDPVDTTGLPKSMEGQLGVAESRSSTPAKTKSHSAKVASLIGQASAGLGSTRDELALQSRPSAERLRAMRKIAHQLSGQEADLLMLCHLDHLRIGQNNNSALAAAVSKLGSGSCLLQDDDETYRRRTLLFMLDRWHALAFGTPHLLTGRFGMESRTFQSMKHALGDVSGSPLGDAVYEVLRAAVMMGQLGDLAQNAGGWKHISLSDVDAVIHSATDENEAGARSADEGIQSLLDSTALRYSLESTVRCYHALHTLPIARDARVDDVQRVFALAENIVVLGSVKTPVSLQGKLLQSAVGPHVLAVAGLAFAWCLRIICRLVSLHADSPAGAELCLPLEHFRRKTLDYVRMCGPFCLFSGGLPTDAGSFKGVYLRLALFFNQAVGLATQMGTLVTTLPAASPARADAAALAADADSLVELAHELGPLGFVLSSTSPREAWRLLEA